MRKFFTRAAVVVIVAIASVVAVSASASVRAINTSAKSAILMDAGSGRVLYEQNADERRAIASITKLMTALVAVELCPPETEMTVSAAHTRAIGSSMYLKAGERLSLEELLYGLLLSSGNDAALVIAEGCAGDVETFVQRMNRRAAELGMTNTHFQNPSGLDEENHYSTARDMAVLAVAAMDHELVRRISSTKSVTVRERRLTNHNKLLWRYDGIVGGKTGYTSKAGRTLISMAERNGMEIAAVTLCDGNDWKDHAALYDFGFDAYQNAALCTKGETLTHLPLKNGIQSSAPLLAGSTVRYPLTENERVEQMLLLPPVAKAPVRAEEPAGSVVWMLNGEVVGESALVWGEDVERIGPLARFFPSSAGKD